MTVRVHPTAIVETGVELGAGTSVWDNVHIRGPARIGSDCIVGEKTYIAYGVDIADRVKINAFVYICTAVTIERGVMIAAGVTFTNDHYPRSCEPDLETLKSSAPDDDTRATRVCEGATVGARAVIGSDLTIGRFAMVGMASLVTHSVPDFHLVIGHPARSVGYVCRCGKPIHKFAGPAPSIPETRCACGRTYVVDSGRVRELVGATDTAATSASTAARPAATAAHSSSKKAIHVQ
jgi:UDP-2-acetamido-3-amino-2,3-dideoxy-glucuronate N-acetyltransferase